MEKKRLSEIVSSIYEISGIEVNICNNNTRKFCFSKSNLTLCPYIHSFPGMYNLCRESDVEHIALMKEQGGEVVYTCPFGVEEMLIPIQSKGVDRGFMFCSMGIDKERADEYIDETARISGAPREELERIYREMPHFTGEQFLALENLLPLIAKQIGDEELISNEYEGLGLLIKYYVIDNLEKKISLTEMSRYFHCSTVLLTESFKEEYGITIMQYVKKKRMQYARKMLLETDKLIKEVALSVGFSDVEYFSRCYREFWKRTPSEQRELEKNKKSEQ